MFGSCSRRRFIHGTAVAALAAFRGSPAWSQALTPADVGVPRWVPDGDLLRSIPRLLELATVPGLALGVIDDEGTWMRGFGQACEQPYRSVEQDTVFEAASLGKPLCAHVALRLVDAGILELDRPLYEYLALPDGDNQRMRRVSLRHVLSHTTGLPNWRKAYGPLEPLTEPGKSFSYSGEAFFYLQRVMETVTDTPFARLMQDRLLRPLGMDNSSYVWHGRFEDRMATGYDAAGQPLEVMAAIGRRTEVIARGWDRPLIDWRYHDAERAVALVNPSWPQLPIHMVPNAACSFLTSVRDYLRFLALVVRREKGETPDVADGTRRAMLTTEVRLNRELSWGLGWGLQRDGDGALLWHWGANNSFRNFVIADPVRGKAAVVFTNSENGPRVYERVLAGLTGRDHAAFLWI
jgi:CubicO group peptidase (beta-lactamase class C family)